MKKGWITIFKSGTHTDAAGNTHTWSEDDVKSMADAYNNQPTEDRHDAPIVKGHPKTDDPAMGWIESLKAESGKLLAKVKNVNKAFAEDVRNGSYRKVSVRLYPDKKLLRHVGFLGATPPAIKGLGDAMLAELATFNDDESSSKEFLEDMDIDGFEFADPTTTVESVKKEQEARSKLFGIAIKPNRAMAMKSEHYKTLKDEDFADPVHYRFPIHDPANTIVSMQLFGRYDTRNEYTEDERQVIGARVVTAAMKHKIDTKENAFHYMFDENNTENNKPDFTNQFEVNVDENTKAFMNAFISKLKEDTNEETATKAQNIFMETFSATKQKTDPKKPDKPEGSDDKTTKPDEKPGNSNFAEDPEFLKLKKQNQELQDKIIFNEFEDFLKSDEMKKRIPPASRESSMNLLKMAYRQDMEFSEGNEGQSSAVDEVKKHLKSLEEVVPLGTAGAPEFSENEFAEEDKFLDEYNKERGM